MTKQPEVRRLAVTGASRGGELALLLGATFAEIEAVVAHSASGLVHDGRPELGTGTDRSAWSLDEKPLPFRTFDTDLNDAVDCEAAIPVERTRGPVLMLC